jgi:hypothetical protein
VAWGGNQFVAVGGDQFGNGTILTSSDGITWACQTGPGYLQSVTWGNNLFVAVGGDNTVLSSTDGMHWTSQISGLWGYLYSVTWGSNRFVIVGLLFTIGTSSDGVVWTEAPISDTVCYILYAVNYGGNQFVAVGCAGRIRTSSDAVIWTTQTSGTTNYLYGITYGDSLFVAVGAGGTILTSPAVNINAVKWPASTLTTSQGIIISGRTIKYSIHIPSLVSIKLYDIRGRLAKTILNCRQSAGSYTLAIPSGLAQGRYILSFRAGEVKIDRRVMIVK